MREDSCEAMDKTDVREIERLPSNRVAVAENALDEWISTRPRGWLKRPETKASTAMPLELIERLRVVLVDPGHPERLQVRAELERYRRRTTQLLFQPGGVDASGVRADLPHWYRGGLSGHRVAPPVDLDLAPPRGRWHLAACNYHVREIRPAGRSQRAQCRAMRSLGAVRS